MTYLSTIFPTTFILGYAGSIGIVSEKTFAPGLTKKILKVILYVEKRTMLYRCFDWKRNANGANITT